MEDLMALHISPVLLITAQRFMVKILRCSTEPNSVTAIEAKQPLYQLAMSFLTGKQSHHKVSKWQMYGTLSYFFLPSRYGKGKKKLKPKGAFV